MTPVDVTRLEIHAEQNAHRYYGGPLGFGESDAIRYTAESWEECDGHGLKATWAAVRAIVERRPELLTSTPAQRATWAADRLARAEQADRDALGAFKAGDWAGVLGAAGRGELADPDYLVGGLRAWDEIRAIVAERAAAV